MALLKKQPFYETDDCDSVIRFGNPNSKLQLTVLNNPYSNTCAGMHKRIEDLLKQVNNDISVQYILSYFNMGEHTKGEHTGSPLQTNKYLIAACLNHPCLSTTPAPPEEGKGVELTTNLKKVIVQPNKRNHY